MPSSTHRSCPSGSFAFHANRAARATSSQEKLRCTRYTVEASSCGIHAGARCPCMALRQCVLEFPHLAAHYALNDD
jgi:hypothetical protein